MKLRILHYLMASSIISLQAGTESPASLNDLSWYKIIKYAVQPLPVSTKAATPPFDEIQRILPKFSEVDLRPDGCVPSIIKGIAPEDLLETQKHIRQAYARTLIQPHAILLLGFAGVVLTDMGLFGWDSYFPLYDVAVNVKKAISFTLIACVFWGILYKGFGISLVPLNQKLRALDAIYQVIERQK